MGSRFRCRVSPTGVAGCEGDGGTGGDVGPTGPTGASGDEPDAEELASTEDDETINVISIEIGEDQLLRCGVAWVGSDAAGNILIDETTFVLKRVGAAASVEIGSHNNGDIRSVSQIVGADTDYVPTATGVDLTVTGAAGTPMNWSVQAWFELYPIG